MICNVLIYLSLTLVKMCMKIRVCWLYCDHGWLQTSSRKLKILLWCRRRLSMNQSSLQNHFEHTYSTWSALSNGVTCTALSPDTHAHIRPRKLYSKYFAWLLDSYSVTCKHHKAVLTAYLKQQSGLLVKIVYTFYLNQLIWSYWGSHVVAPDSNDDFSAILNLLT